VPREVPPLVRRPVRPEIRWVLAAAGALGLGVTFASQYAELAAPYYGNIARLMAAGHPWDVESVGVHPGKSHLSAELQLRGYVRRHREDREPAARVIGRVQVGEAVETPLLFWSLLLLWPATSLGQRAVRLLAGVPVWLGLEAITTASQLMLPLAQASAILAGDNDPITLWDRWSRFLEAGGQFALVCGFGVIVAASTGSRHLAEARAASLS
jgi:hypothetical protein